MERCSFLKYTLYTEFEILCKGCIYTHLLNSVSPIFQWTILFNKLSKVHKGYRKNTQVHIQNFHLSIFCFNLSIHRQFRWSNGIQHGIYATLVFGINGHCIWCNVYIGPYCLRHFQSVIIGNAIQLFQFSTKIQPSQW